MEDCTTDETLLDHQHQVERTAGEYQHIEQECAALLERINTHGLLSVGSAEIIGMIQTYGAASRNYHAALMSLIKEVGCEGDGIERIAQCQQLLDHVQIIEQQHKRYVLRLDNVVIEFLRFVEQTTPHVKNIRYGRAMPIPKRASQCGDGCHPRHLPADGAHVHASSVAQASTRPEHGDAYSTL